MPQPRQRAAALSVHADNPAPETERSLWLMCLLAAATGVIAGVGACGFRMMIGFVHNLLFLGVPAFDYDANVHTPIGPWGWSVVFAPVVGSVVVAWLVKNFAPRPRATASPR